MVAKVPCFYSFPSFLLSFFFSFFLSFEQNRTPTCSYEVSAAGLSWLEHFQVQCYRKSSLLLSYYRSEVEGFRDQGFVLPQVESLRVQSLWLLKKALPSREEPDVSLSTVNSKAHFYTHALRACYCPKPDSALNTRSNDFIRIVDSTLLRMQRGAQRYRVM